MAVRRSRKPRPTAPAKDNTRINLAITAREVRVIDDEGQQLGIMSADAARNQAEARGLDLVEISGKSTPPVCRIMDYGKFKYQASKKLHEAKKKQTVIKVKEIKLRPKTEEHDFQFKLKHALEFLESGNKVKVTVMFRGREMAYSQQGLELLAKFATHAEELGVVESQPKHEGRTAQMILGPKKTKS